MMLYVLSYYNTKIKAFTTPQYIDIEPHKAATQLKRSIIGVKAEEVNKITVYRDLIFYNFGLFDDETGKFQLKDEPELLLECKPIVDEVLAEYLPEKKDEVVEDGSNN